MKNVKEMMLLLLLATCCGASLWAQSPAAMEKLQQKYNAAQLEDIRLHTHHKYVGLQAFYASSFQVIDNGQARVATEDEIRRIQLDGYNALRQESANVNVYDAILQKDILLLSRDAFEQLVLQQLSVDDRQAYLAYKAQAQAYKQKTNQ